MHIRYSYKSRLAIKTNGLTLIMYRGGLAQYPNAFELVSPLWFCLNKYLTALKLIEKHYIILFGGAWKKVKQNCCEVSIHLDKVRKVAGTESRISRLGFYKSAANDHQYK